MYLIIFLLLCASVSAVAQKSAIGKVAPEYSSLEWVRPTAVSAHEFDSSVVILEFWATWCAPCIKHLPALVEVEKKYKEHGVKVVAVSWDARHSQIDSFVKAREMPQYVCIDKGNTMFLKRYNERGIPYAIMFGRDGRAIWEGTSDSLTPHVIETYLNTGVVPPDPSEEDLTSFSLSVRKALASDKNGVAMDYPTNSFIEITSQPAIGLITNTAEFLGMRQSKREQIGEMPSGLFNLRMKIDTSLRSMSMLVRCLAQLDDIFGTHTTVEYRKRTVYAVTYMDSTRSPAATTSSKDAKTPAQVRLYSATGQIQYKFGIEMIVDELGLGERMITFPSTLSTLDMAISSLHDVGFFVRKEERLLPTIVIAGSKH